MSLLTVKLCEGEGVLASYACETPWFSFELRTVDVYLLSPCCGENVAGLGDPLLGCMDCELPTAWPEETPRWAFTEVLSADLFELWLAPFLSPLEAAVTAAELFQELIAFAKTVPHMELQEAPAVYSAGIFAPVDVATASAALVR